MSKEVEQKGLQLEDLKVSNLPEFQGWKEKQEKERLENERVSKIKTKINDFESDSYKIIQETNIGNVELHKSMLDAFVNDGFDYEEYDIMFEQAKMRIQSSWDFKCNEIQEKEEQRLENLRIKEELFDVRVKRMQDVGFDFEDGFFTHKQLGERFTEIQVKDVSGLLFEEELSEVKYKLNKIIQDQADAELKKQKDEQFEIRKNRLAEIGVVMNIENMFVVLGYFYISSKELVYNASISEFEKILSDAKKSIQKAKEQKELLEKQRLESEELELNNQQEADKKAIADKKELDSKNKARVKRLANDKKVVAESLEVYFSKVYLETENKEILDFINGANNLIQGLKSELLTQLNEL